MNRVAQHLALAISLVCLPWMMGADVYRWVDGNGVVNYTQQRPLGVESVRVEAFAGKPSRSSRVPAATEVPAGTSSSVGADNAPPAGGLSQEQQAMLDDLKRIESDRQQEITKIKKDNCERAKNVLKKLTQIGRIRLTGADGKERVLPEEERQQRINDAQQGVAANCSSTG